MQAVNALLEGDVEDPGAEVGVEARRVDAAGNELGGKPDGVAVGDAPGVVAPAGDAAAAKVGIAGEVVLRTLAGGDDLDAGGMGGSDVCESAEGRERR